MKNPAPFGKGNDYMAIMHSSNDMPEQAVPVEKGNGAGPVAGDQTLGADIPEGSYAAGIKDAKAKEG